MKKRVYIPDSLADSAEALGNNFNYSRLLQTALHRKLIFLEEERLANSEGGISKLQDPQEAAVYFSNRGMKWAKVWAKFALPAEIKEYKRRISNKKRYESWSSLLNDHHITLCLDYFYHLYGDNFDLKMWAKGFFKEIQEQ